MPVAVIRAIRADQESYDRDPEEYERWERVKEEETRREQERLQERFYEEQQAALEAHDAK